MAIHQQNRTNEFKACVESFRNRSTASTRNARKDPQRSSSSRKGPSTLNEFFALSTTIARDIIDTRNKLEKLAQLAKRTALFDDRPVEISELAYIIKQKIAGINKNVATLQADVNRSKNQVYKAATDKEVVEYSSVVVVLLQSKLASTSISFKDVLEVRTQNMKESKDRTDRFMHSTVAAAAAQAPSNSLLHASSRPSHKGYQRVANGDMLALDLDSAEAGMGNGATAQMQLVEQQDTYIQTRASAIQSIESTISELGQIFSQLAQVVAEQRETVQRIDADTVDIAHNVSAAQRELLKYYAGISSNRWLMLKVFGVLIIFFLFSEQPETVIFATVCVFGYPCIATTV